MNKFIARIWKPFISFCILAYIWNTIAIEDLQKVINQIRLEPLLLALAVFMIAQIIAAQRFVYVMRTLKRRVSLNLSIRVHFIGLWFNQVLPTSLGGDMVKVMVLRKRLGISRAIRGALLDRISGFMILMLSTLVLLPFYHSVVGEDSLTITAGVLSTGFFIGLIIAIYFSGKSQIRKRLPRSFHYVFLLLQDIRRFRKWRPFYRQLWTSIVVHLNGIAAYALIGKALGVNLSLSIYVLLVPLVFLVALIPISFAGWGIRETGAIGLFSIVGVTAEEAFAMSLVFGLLLIVAGLPGGVLWFFKQKTNH